ncbi:hypothetical protein DPMN_094433 [Dreissena polymorpha]|uniref:Uncharacterized protein n=1 Tax=Dreissena polymorpha TaxID=45954 RepID=A0A9D4L5H6_DREPO|nr:hypothetical protein DPMN_094433 [Dreissena polymorpha]
MICCHYRTVQFHKTSFVITEQFIVITPVLSLQDSSSSQYQFPAGTTTNNLLHKCINQPRSVVCGVHWTEDISLHPPRSCDSLHTRDRMASTCATETAGPGFYCQETSVKKSTVFPNESREISWCT